MTRPLINDHRINVDADELEEALVCLLESQMQAGDDFCGQQRDWHLPRLNRAAIFLMKLFPKQAARAVQKAKTPYDD